MKRAIRLIAGLSFVTLLGAATGNSVNAQEMNTRQPPVQVTRQGSVQVSRQPAVQVTRGQTGPLTESRANARKAAIDYQMELARKRFPDVDIDARSRDLDLREKESRLPRFGDTDIDARTKAAAGAGGVGKKGAEKASAKPFGDAPVISPFDKKNQDGSIHRVRKEDSGTRGDRRDNSEGSELE